MRDRWIGEIEYFREDEAEVAVGISWSQLVDGAVRDRKKMEQMENMEQKHQMRGVKEYKGM